MAVAVNCWALPSKLATLSLNSNPSSKSSSSAVVRSLSFSSNASHNLFSNGFLSMRPVMRPIRHSIVCDATTTKKPDSAAKRARQAEKSRIYNKSRKSEIRTRMKKVLEELELLRKKTDAQPEEVIEIEKLIAEAYSTIDKAVRVGTLHKNTGANRKSRLARRKRAIEIHHGWYTPSSSSASASVETATAE